jgi:hypothetical protein
MTVIYSKGLAKLKYPIPHDPDEEKFYTFAYRPQVWSPGLELVFAEEVILPTVPSGFMHEVVGGGVTGATEPTWQTVENKFTEDNTVKFKALPATGLLNRGDVVSESDWEITDSTFVGVLTEPSIVGGIATKVKLSQVPAEAKTVHLLNKVTVIRVNGDEEKFNRTIIIPVKQL